MGQVGADHLIQGLIRAHLDEVHAQRRRRTHQLAIVGFDLLQIRLPQLARIELALARGLEPLEPHQVVEVELELLRVLSTLPEALELALRERAPHKITTWVRESASAFHGFYHDCPILRSDIEVPVQQARLWLTEATRIALAVSLDLLGVSAPEQM